MMPGVHMPAFVSEKLEEAAEEFGSLDMRESGAGYAWGFLGGKHYFLSADRRTAAGSYMGKMFRASHNKGHFSMLHTDMTRVHGLLVFYEDIMGTDFYVLKIRK